LVPFDGNASSDVFRYDRLTNSLTIVSTLADGSRTDAGGSASPPNSTAGAISGDGSTVAFLSTATNLVSGDTNGVADVFVKAIQPNTPTGNGVQATPIDASSGGSPVSVTFNTVTQAGITSLTTSNAGTPPPTGFQLGSPGIYYDISTTAIYSGSVSICINYTGISFTQTPQLFHFENGGWVNVTTSVDTIRMIVCGAVSSLSPFALFQGTPPSITSLSASPNVLWPPNHKMVSVSLNVAATGAPTPTCQISSVTSNEGSTSLDDIAWVVTGPLTVNLLAQRAGSGDGRVYTVTVTCTNSAGSAAQAVMVNVPHDQGR
jgi:hypothetical protein